jgi:hypothetical protein
VQKYLHGADYPATRKDLLDQARQNSAPDEVMDVIQRMPDQEFGGPQDVMKAYGEIE